MNIYKVKPIGKAFKKSIKAPSSKSYTNRALLIATLAEGKSIIKNCLLSDDTEVMIEALKSIGVKIKQSGNDFEVEGTNGFKSLENRELRTERKPNQVYHKYYNNNSQFSTLTTQLYLGNAGTAVRSLTAAMTLAPFDSIITGNERMQQRPVSDLVDGLNQLGAEIEFLKDTKYQVPCPNTVRRASTKYYKNCPPLLIHGNTLKGGTCKIHGNQSSQYFSAIMISAPYAKEEITIEVIGELVSKPYIDMTIQIMEEFGAKVQNINYQRFIISNEQKYYSREYEVEADASSASYPFAIAAATGSTITVENANYNSMQGDIKFVDILERMKCIVKKAPLLKGVGGIGIMGPTTLKPLGSINLNYMPDAAMTVAVLCALTKGKSILTGLANLRLKECDRLKALTTELIKIGAKVKELPDGLEIDGDPKKLHGAEIETYDDHRMAMCFAVLGTKIPGIVIKNPDCVNKTYPNFWKDLKKISTT